MAILETRWRADVAGVAVDPRLRLLQRRGAGGDAAAGGGPHPPGRLQASEGAINKYELLIIIIIDTISGGPHPPAACRRARGGGV